MLIRRIVGIVAAIVFLIGLLEITLPNWARRMTETIMAETWLRLIGVFAMALGVIMLVAAVKRVVGLRLFVLIAGVYVIVTGLVVFAGPDLIRDLVDAIFLNRSYGFQTAVLWISGLIRMAFGAALFYAVAKPPRVEPSQDA